LERKLDSRTKIQLKQSVAEMSAFLLFQLRTFCESLKKTDFRQNKLLFLSNKGSGTTIRRDAGQVCHTTSDRQLKKSTISALFLTQDAPHLVELARSEKMELLK
jgi:hypothetical protein